MLGKFIAGDFIAIAGEMCQFPASSENTVIIKQKWKNMHFIVVQMFFKSSLFKHRFGISTCWYDKKYHLYGVSICVAMQTSVCPYSSL